MNMQDQDSSQKPQDNLKLKKLTLEQAMSIDAMLESLTDYGEIHLIVQHGELRYMNRVESYKVWTNPKAKPPSP